MSPASFQQRMERKGPMESTAWYHHRPLRGSVHNGSWQAVVSRVPHMRKECVCPFSEAPAPHEPRSLEMSGVFHLDGRLEDCPGIASQELPGRASAATVARRSRAWPGTSSVTLGDAWRPALTSPPRLHMHAGAIPAAEAGSPLL